MKTIIYPMLLIVATCAASLVFASCEKKGPAEKAGEKVDDAVEKAGDKIEDATD